MNKKKKMAKTAILGRYSKSLLSKSARKAPKPAQPSKLLKTRVKALKDFEKDLPLGKFTKLLLSKVKAETKVEKRAMPRWRSDAGLKKLKKKVKDEQLPKNVEAKKREELAHEKISTAEKPIIQIKGFPTYNATAHGPLAVFDGIKDYEELKRYWVNEPFAFATILFNRKHDEQVYHIVEPALTETEKTLLEQVYEYLNRTLAHKTPSADKSGFLAQNVAQAFKFLRVSAPPQTAHKILYYIHRMYIGYGEIDPLMKDPYIEDISCNGLGVPLFLYHRKYYHIPTTTVFKDEARLNSFVTTLVERCGKMISFGKPTVDATLPDGSRLQATLGSEITTRGSSFTIRKFTKEPFTPTHLIKYNTYSPEMLAYLWLATENKKNAMIIGGTASGKTSTLNAIVQFIPPAAKIISLEETRELTFYQDNWIPSVTRETIGGEMPITLYDLLRQGLRQRPECIVVGEVRGKEGLVLFQAMSTGHTCYSTMHASTVQEAVNRLEGEPINVPHQMLTALNILCFQLISSLGKERVRRVHSIFEFAGLDPTTGSIRINEIYRWDPTNDTFEKVGDSVVLKDIMAARGWGPRDLTRELENRVKILEYLTKRNIEEYEQVSRIMRQFYTNPEKLMQQIASKKLSAP